MTLVTQLIDRVHVAGGRIQVHKGKLKLSAPKPLTADLIESLTKHKVKIIQVLCAHCGNTITAVDPMVIDATTGADPHPHFHAQCYEPWLIAHRNVARQALSAQ